MELKNLNLLHDATLLSLKIDWKSGLLNIEVLTQNGAQSIIGEQVSDLHVPRQKQWGPSASINLAKIEVTKSYSKVTLEMQSGDNIVVQALKFELKTLSKD